jgi:hypothetical protein
LVDGIPSGTLVFMARTARSKTTRGRQLVCPTCGFKAAHAAGLGRHRSAIHGVLSQRQRREKAAGPRRRRASVDADLAKRVAALERRYERLLSSLERLVRQAKRPG